MLACLLSRGRATGELASRTLLIPAYSLRLWDCTPCSRALRFSLDGMHAVEQPIRMLLLHSGLLCLVSSSTQDSSRSEMPSVPGREASSHRPPRSCGRGRSMTSMPAGVLRHYLHDYLPMYRHTPRRDLATCPSTKYPDIPSARPEAQTGST